MPEKDQKSKLSCTTGKAYFSKSSSPKYKYIQDPSDFVDNNYKNDYSQYLIPYDVLTLNIVPVWGSYSGQQIKIQYDWDGIKFVINGKENADVMPLKPGTSPDCFLRFAIALIHSPTIQTDLCSIKARVFQPASLLIHCLRSALVHIKRLPELLPEYLPREFLVHFSAESQISVQLNVWPSCEKWPRKTMITAQRGMVIEEFLWLIRYILKLDSQVRISLFRRFLPLDNQDVLSEDDVIDCVINPKDMCTLLTSDSRNGNKKFVLTKIGPTKFEILRKEVLVVSLMGKGVKEMPISLTDSLSVLDRAVRQAFRLRQSTLLSFKHPNQESFLLHAGKVIKSQTDEEKVKNLITNKRRNFPARGSCVPIKCLYKESPIYIKSLKSLGFCSGCFVEVFEVTGPTIPIMLFGEAIEPCAVDVNPEWNLELFLYYLQIFCGRGEKFTNIDYVRFIADKNVSDILDMMGSLWWKDKRSSVAMTNRLEYLKVRV